MGISSLDILSNFACIPFVFPIIIITNKQATVYRTYFR